MGLTNNYSILNNTDAQFFSGTTTAGAFAALTPENQLQYKFDIQSFDWPIAIAAIPFGYRAPYALGHARSDGGISSYTTAVGAITAAASMAAGRNLSSTTALALAKANAALDQIVSAVASGSMSISVASAIMAGAANASASGACAVTVADALCGAIFSVTATTSMAASGTGSFLTALANMEAEAGGPTGLSAQEIADATWNALLSDYGISGSMAEELRKKLNLSDFVGLK